MNKLTEQLEMAKRHVAEGLRHIAKQEALIRKLERLGHPTAMAETLLDTFQESQLLHERDLKRILRG